MAGPWYCKISGQTSDALSPQELKALANQGKLGPNDLVRHGDQGPWIPAVCVKGLLPTDGSQASLPEETAKPQTETARRGPAKYSTRPGPKPAPPRKGKSLPVARPMDEPPAAPESSEVQPAAPKPPPPRLAKASGAVAAPSDPLAIAPVTDTATHRALGRAAASPRKRHRNNMLAVVILSVLVVGVGVVGAILLASRNEGGGVAPDGNQVAVSADSTGARRPDPAATHSAGTASRPPARAPEGRDVDASRAGVTRDNVSVRIVSATIGIPPGEVAFTRTNYLLITVEVANRHANKDLRFFPWSGSAPLDTPVVLADNTGKNYRQRIGRGEEEPATTPPAEKDAGLSGKVSEVLGSQFGEEVLKAKGLVLVSFWSPKSEFAERYAPVVEELAARNAGSVRVVRVNVDENRAIATRYEVRGEPTLVLFKDGEAVEKVLGGTSPDRVQEMLEGQSRPARGAAAGRATAKPLPAAGSLEDVLVFEPPASEVKYLRLTLPAAAFGSAGTLNFMIPAKMIKAAGEVEQTKPSTSPRAKPDRPAEKTPTEPVETTEPPKQVPAPKKEPSEFDMDQMNKDIDAVGGGDKTQKEFDFEQMLKNPPKEVPSKEVPRKKALPKEKPVEEEPADDNPFDPKPRGDRKADQEKGGKREPKARQNAARDRE